MAHTHHDDHSGSATAGAASWLVAMVAFLVLALALVVALFVWAPWDDDGTVGTGGDVPGVNEGTDEDGIDINADVDIDGGDGGDSGSGQ